MSLDLVTIIAMIGLISFFIVAISLSAKLSRSFYMEPAFILLVVLSL